MIEVKRIKILSAAKMFAILMLIMGVLNSLMSVFSALVTKQNVLNGPAPIVFFIAFPLIYGVIGFFVGALLSAIYNVAAKILGGIVVETQAK
jgi:hypothetical protein